MIIFKRIPSPWVWNYFCTSNWPGKRGMTIFHECLRFCIQHSWNACLGSFFAGESVDMWQIKFPVTICFKAVHPFTGRSRCRHWFQETIYSRKYIYWLPNIEAVRAFAKCLRLGPGNIRSRRSGSRDQVYIMNARVRYQNTPYISSKNHWSPPI